MLSLFAEIIANVRRDVRWISGAGVPTDAVTGAGDCGPGSLYTDTTGKKLYINSGTGTKASPVWKLVTSA